MSRIALCRLLSTRCFASFILFTFNSLSSSLPPQAVFSKVYGIFTPSCSSNKEISTCMIFSMLISFSATCTTSLICMNHCLYLLLTFSQVAALYIHAYVFLRKQSFSAFASPYYSLITQCYYLTESCYSLFVTSSLSCCRFRLFTFNPQLKSLYQHKILSFTLIIWYNLPIK